MIGGRPWPGVWGNMLPLPHTLAVLGGRFVVAAATVRGNEINVGRAGGTRTRRFHVSRNN